MKISVIGTGYVGLVTGTCLSEMGNDVVCVDVDKDKVEKLKKGILPIYETGLEEIVKRNYTEERLFFTTDIKKAVEDSLFIFITVETPPREEDGKANLDKVIAVSKSIGQYINNYKIIINKSTVPVGTGELVRNTIQNEIDNRINKNSLDKLEEVIEFDIVSNPEFLKEGTAVEDFMKPDRVVIGTDNVRVAELMKELYSPFVRNEHPIITMDVRSAEMTKYACNSFLATKISFINEMANLAELLGVDITNVRKGMAADSRIGYQFLFPGVGYGGACFPKDIKALNAMAKTVNYEAHILEAVEEVNKNQKKILSSKIVNYFSKKLNKPENTENLLKGITICVWGLSFKPNTDDMREAPSIIIINDLIKKGAKIRAFDPKAIITAKAILDSENIEYFENMYEALDGADVIALITEWTQFRRPDFEKIKKLLKTPVIFDGRNQYDPLAIKKLGFEYFCIGRQSNGKID